MIVVIFLIVAILNLVSFCLLSKQSTSYYYNELY
jgi:hypothetical protein